MKQPVRLKVLFQRFYLQQILVNIHQYTLLLHTVSTPVVNQTMASFYYDEKNQTLICCSNSRRPPKMSTILCTHAITCALRKTPLALVLV